MTTKTKSLMILAATMILIITLLVSLSYIVFSQYVQRLENESVNTAFNNLNQVLQREEESILRTTIDWAYWDQTYYFLKGGNNGYIASNLGEDILEQLSIDFMFFMKPDQDIFYERSDIVDIERKIMIDKMIYGTPSDLVDEAHAGMFATSERVFLIARVPVSIEDSLESAGTLIFGKAIGEDFLAYIETLINGKIHFGESYKEVMAVSSIQMMKEQDILSASTLLQDINGESSIEAVFGSERVIKRSGVMYYNIFLKILFGELIIVVLLVVFLTNKFFIQRINKITQFIDAIAATQDRRLDLISDGDDAFNQVADAIHQMLADLEASHKNAREMDERFRRIMEVTRDGYIDLHLDGENRVYINEEWRNHIGLEDEMECRALIHPQDQKKLAKQYQSLIEGECDYAEEEYRMVKKTGEVIWVSEKSRVVAKDQEGRAARIIFILSDITLKKVYEEEILTLSYSDKLTGLKNRAFLEQRLQDLDLAGTSYYLIMGDINGLKLINDSLGHKQGDMLIAHISNVLKRVCDGSIIARWGGDEFVILLESTQIEDVEMLIDKLKKQCNQIEDFPIKISISIGYAVKQAHLETYEIVLNLAEQRMYHNKLMESKSVRNAIISSLLKTLHEKHSETQEHTVRIRNMSLKIGERLGLSKDKLDDLELLALLHDIGKIGIPENILLKPGKLTQEEWQIMQTHSEIGYRIAKSTTELAHIAEEILAHHEKYDGTGYPNGLKGEEIPILSRIINAVDAYDVMTHKRVYKDAYQKDYATRELKRCSGSQFDPRIVEELLEICIE